MNDAKFYRLMYLCRRTDERIAVGVQDGKIRLPIHLSIGQEFIASGVCSALDGADVVFGTYRGHALYLSKGGCLKKLIAEMYGKKSGCSSGKGGSMHVIDTNVGVMGTSGIVGTGLPNAVGYAYGLKQQGHASVVVCMFGDGAVDEGVFYESLNFAALKKLNVIFVCENNSYAIRSHQSSRHAVCNISQRATPFGIPSEVIPSKIESVYASIKQAKQNMLKTPGPRFFECAACRWKEHLGANDDFGEYRCDQNVPKWIAEDEMKRIGEKLEESVKHEIEEQVEKEIEEAFALAENSPFPECDDLYSDLFAER